MSRGTTDSNSDRGDRRAAPREVDADRYVVGLDAVDSTRLGAVGGKAAHLGELMQLGRVRVPPGFCVTTDAYRSVVSGLPSIETHLDRLDHVEPTDAEPVRELTAAIRQEFERVRIPDNLLRAITGAVEQLGETTPCAVRSSATAEDLPTASFAGQQDTFLNLLGSAEILRHIIRCWASLFSDRAVSYRMRHGIDHRSVEMAVVVQHMAAAKVSGVLFTADPSTGNRKIASVEATFGLGEALVSGLVNADRYRVRDGGIVDRQVATKLVAIQPSAEGGTQEAAIEPAQQSEPSLSDDQVLELVRLGRRLDEHFGRPQDIEWCLDDDGFQIVQSRPITTLFPIPEAADDANRVYVSVGHQQMMTDPMTPLGLSVWQLTSPAPMRVAGGRLFVDVSDRLASPAACAAILDALGKSDPLIRDALETILERDAFVPAVSDGEPPAGPPEASGPPEPIETDPAVVTDLIERNRASVAKLAHDIRRRSGSDLFDFILTDIGELRARLFDPRSHRAVMAGMEATWWLNDNLQEWLGERNAADVLSLSAPNNVTAQMGLALLDVADAIRPHPEVIAFLADAGDDGFIEELAAVPGGAEATIAIGSYLDAYGMRCAGEIDIGRPRWRERPTALLPMILSNIENFEPGESQRRVERGQQRALDKAREIMERLGALPDGAAKAADTEQMIDRLRTFIGYREYPKYGMVSTYFIYRQAILDEAERLVAAGVLDAIEDVFFFAFDELHEVVRNSRADRELVARRREELHSFGALTPPRVLTSDGEALNGSYRRDDLPTGALLGLAVSGGTIEGRAHVVLDMAEADLEPGDILVTRATDPSWSPLFVAAAGLVTEVGGLMTHGAVIAREYGLVAVVGVDDATQVIQDGERLRVDGTQGYVERLSAT